jgi:hypothetical protein
MDFVAALARCATAADHYRVQMDAENIITPAEVDALGATALPEPARIWVDRLKVMCRRIQVPIQPFRRRDLAANATFYEGSGPPGAPRSLVIGFTGVGLRMMMPVAPFLQALPAERCDVLVLRDPGRAHFMCGVPGYADDLPALAARLGDDLPLSRYADRRCLGASSGGAAALAFGALIGARLALGLGAAHPRAMTRRAGMAELDPQAFGRLIADAPPGATTLVCAHGEESRRDSVRSRLLAMSMPGGRLLIVRGVSDHAVLAGLLPYKALGRFFDEILLGDTLPADGFWQP